MNSSLHNGNSSICFLQALTHISQTLEQLQASDFIVVDVLVKPKVLTSLTSWLMTSTVWFDSNNGESWASYNDDGLIHPDFASLAKVLNCCSYYGLLNLFFHFLTGIGKFAVARSDKIFS